MQRFADVSGEKRLPFPKGRARCACCGGMLIAKCGQIKTHHWAHESRDDCDSWSEPIGPWHLWWQGLVQPAFTEVARGPHRADIVGNGGIVVELQHSSISAEDIAAREAFYGNMVWLFDATQRFAYMKSGDRAFFSFGQTKHLDVCRKPVFLDFGFDVVQVECFTESITMVSGIGIPRSREWFADALLSEVRQAGRSAGGLFTPQGESSYPWSRQSPVWKLKHPTRWMEPRTGRLITYPKWTEYIKLNHYHYTVGDSQNKHFDYEKVIERHPDIANGWTPHTLREMQEFFFGTAIILGGVLRMLPFAADAIPVKKTVGAMERFLQLADVHIQAGRLPILKDSTKAMFLEKARQHELAEYGRVLRADPPKMPAQGSLFE